MGVWSPQDPLGTSALGHCGIQFRLIGVLFPQDPLGLELWDIVGFSSGWQEMGHHRTHVVLALGHCGLLFRRMESGLLKTHWGFSFGAL